MSDALKNRYDFVLFFDVKDGNPNGDPDAGNLPRMDPETGQGLVTDVCLKRKVRNFVQMTRGEEPSYGIFIREKGILNDMIMGAYDALKIDLNADPKDKNDGKRDAKKKGKGSEIESARQWMCQTYYDIRTFGAVMSTGVNAGQVRGPVQFTFARSVDPISVLEHSITRMAVASGAKKQRKNQSEIFQVATSDEVKKQKDKDMGHKATIPYGIYMAYGFISPYLAAQTGFNQTDLDLFWEALVHMFEHDRSAARGLMSTCKIVVFKHDSALGNASSRDLFDRVRVVKKSGESPAMDRSDYEITIVRENLPDGIEIIEMA